MIAATIACRPHPALRFAVVIAAAVALAILSGAPAGARSLPRPAAIPPWQSMNGPSAGWLISLVRTPDGVLIAGSWTGGIYRSTDNGFTWTEPQPALHHIKAQALAVAPNGHLFATCSATDGVYSQNGCFRSTDNGATWQRTTNTDPFPTATAAAPNGDIYQGGFNGAFRSTDEGATWAFIGSVGPSGFVGMMSAARDGTVYYYTAELSGSDQLVRYRPDEGRTPLGFPLASHNVSAVFAAPNGDVYVGAYEGLYRSRNRGQGWTEVKPGGRTLGGVLSIGADSGGHLYVSAGTNGIYRSDDNGDTWAAAGTGLLNTGLHAFAADTSGGIYAASYGDGVYYSANHTSWESRSSGLLNSDVRTLATSPSGTVFAGTNGGGLYRLQNGAWERVALNRANITALLATADGTLYAGTTAPSGGTPGVFRSTDEGATWTPLDASGASGQNIVQDREGTLFFCDGANVYRLRTGDASWTRIRSGSNVHALAVDSTGALFIGVQDTGMFRSADHGETWKLVMDISGTFTDITAIAVGSGEMFAAGTTFGRSVDGGLTWQRIDAPATRSWGYVLMVDRDGSLYVGANQDGVFRTTDHGATWDSLNTGLVSIAIHALARDSSGHIIAGTETAGLYGMTSLSAVPDGNGAGTGAPAAITISSMPNPCNSVATIRFGTALPGRIRIDLFDARGAHVRSAADADVAAGVHALRLDVQDLASGLYRCTITCGAVTAQTAVIVQH
ncbi:MAG TPA: hypothetical protein VHI13_10330 [Candidatus Kapabacteria bacterium]|nr:hypothetical protein [Candidatus Kapabacteria bacterium]